MELPQKILKRSSGVASMADLKLAQCSAMQQALRKEWHTLHPRGHQQDGAEFCTVVLAKLAGISWGHYDSRCQFEQPEKHPDIVEHCKRS